MLKLFVSFFLLIPTLATGEVKKSKIKNTTSKSLKRVSTTGKDTSKIDPIKDLKSKLVECKQRVEVLKRMLNDKRQKLVNKKDQMNKRNQMITQASGNVTPNGEMQASYMENDEGFDPSFYAAPNSYGFNADQSQQQVNPQQANPMMQQQANAQYIMAQQAQNMQQPDVSGYTGGY